MFPFFPADGLRKEKQNLERKLLGDIIPSSFLSCFQSRKVNAFALKVCISKPPKARIKNKLSFC